MPAGDMRMIDIQTHYIAPEARELLTHISRNQKIYGIGSLNASQPIFGLDDRLRAMDASGVEVSLLSFAPISAIDDPILAAQLCTAANDGLLTACTAYPDRFVMAAMLPLPLADASIIELDRIVDNDALRAVQIVAQTTGYIPEAPDFLHLWEQAAKAKLPILIHPSAGVADLSPLFDVYGLSSGMHAMISHALVAARFMQSGVLDMVPELEVILTHLGGILPFMIDRLDSRAIGPALHRPSTYLRNRVHADICGYPAGPALRAAIDIFGPDRLMIGSDWPSRPINDVAQALVDLELLPESERAIAYGNAARWFDPAASRWQG